MQNPLVSIGIPTYNRPILCQKAIESVLNQSYENIEIIVSDNSNNLETKSIVLNLIQKNLTLKNIIYKKQENNIGGINNFNYVLNQSHGEFFLLLEDEIILDEYFVGKAIDYLLENNEYIGVSGTFIYERNHTQKKEKTSHIISSYPIIRSCIIWSTHNTSIFFSLFRANECKAISYRNEYAFDRTFLSHLMFKGKLYVLESCCNARSFKHSISNEKNGYKNIFKSLGMKYRGVFLSQLTVSIYAFKSAQTNPFIKSSLEKIIYGSLFFCSSIVYTIFYQNLYLKLYKRNSLKNLDIYRKWFYIINERQNYKKFFLGNRYLKINDYHKIQQILSEISGSDYAIYGAGQLCDIFLYEIKKKNLNPPTNIIVSNKAEPYKNFNTITPNKLINTTCKYVFIASYSYKEEMINTLIKNKYTGKIIYLD